MSDGPGRVALVTGAGTGIGRASALALAERGFSLVLAGRRKNLLDAAAAAITAAGGRATSVGCDVGDEDDVRELFARTRSEFGRLDVLFNNAGGNAAKAGIAETTLADWQQVLSANLTGAFLCTREAFRLMIVQRPSGGRIINNGSLSAHVPRPGAVAYTASKHGVTGLTRQTALDGRRYNIACGQIDIGNAVTSGGGNAGQISREQPDGSIRTESAIDVGHVARAVAEMADLPLDVNILSMTVMATTIPYVGRG
jgi:NAD(P)-dependent dehydrogenase (short-subunit alcohol dehydrogenase family)